MVTSPNCDLLSEARSDMSMLRTFVRDQGRRTDDCLDLVYKSMEQLLVARYLIPCRSFRQVWAYPSQEISIYHIITVKIICWRSSKCPHLYPPRRFKPDLRSPTSRPIISSKLLQLSQFGHQWYVIYSFFILNCLKSPFLFINILQKLSQCFLLVIFLKVNKWTFRISEDVLP